MPKNSLIVMRAIGRMPDVLEELSRDAALTMTYGQLAVRLGLVQHTSECHQGVGALIGTILYACAAIDQRSGRSEHRALWARFVRTTGLNGGGVAKQARLVVTDA